MPEGREPWRDTFEVVAPLTAFLVAIGGLPNLFTYFINWRTHSIARHLKSLEAAALAVDIEEKLHNRGISRTDLTNIRFILEDFNTSTGMLREESLDAAADAVELAEATSLDRDVDLQRVVDSFAVHMKRPAYFRFLLCPRSYGAIAVVTKIFFQLFRISAFVWLFPFLLVLTAVIAEPSDSTGWEVLGVITAFQIGYLGLMLLFRYATMQNTIGRIRKHSFRHFVQLRTLYSLRSVSLSGGHESAAPSGAASVSHG